MVIIGETLMKKDENLFMVGGRMFSRAGAERSKDPLRFLK